MILFDIETNGLLDTVTKIHCGWTYNFTTEVYTGYKPHEMLDLIDDLSCATHLVGHNIIAYDIPVIKKLYGIDLSNKEITDTLILSQLAFYNLFDLDVKRRCVPGKMYGSHSLKAWGVRLNENKGDYGEQEDAWHSYNEDMYNYCEQDVRLNVLLHKRLTQEKVPSDVLHVEQEFAKIIQRQHEHGWLFDKDKAEELYTELNTRKVEIENELRQSFQPLCDFKELKEIPQFTQAGKPSKAYQNQLDKGAYRNSEGLWGYNEYVEFNPGSRHHIIRWMKEKYNWESPVNTDKGNPKVDDEILKDVEYPEAQLLREYFLHQKVMGMLKDGANGWLKCVRPDNRIHGSINTLGAVTGRCTHSKPNVSQTPSNRAFKGEECRKLWKCPEGKAIVGCDASGLELRMLSHYMSKYDGGKYGEIVVNGDIHTENMKAAGLETRDQAKTFIYAFIYGAGNAKIGLIAGGDSRLGGELKDNFLSTLPALKRLIDDVQMASKRGHLLGLNGRKLFVREEHKALNVLLQGAGALVMKYYLVELDKELSKKYRTGIDYEFVGNIHDEVAIEVTEEFAEDVAKHCQNTFHKLKSLLNLSVELDGEPKIGKNWSEVH